MARFYIKNSIISLEEDQTHEFKAHTAFVEEEIPPNAVKMEGSRLRSTHQAISKTVCAFLNTGNGGTVYLGIADDGRVKGLSLTQYKIDHITLSIKNMMSRFTCPVRPHQYSVEFVQILENGVSADDLSNRSITPSKTKQRHQPHLIETYRNCWCVSEATAMYKSGLVPISYVVELVVFPWDKDHPCNQDLRVGKLGLHPVYQNEIGKCYFRKQGCVQWYTLQEVMNLSIQETKAIYEAEIKRLTDRLACFNTRTGLAKINEVHRN